MTISGNPEKKSGAHMTRRLPSVGKSTNARPLISGGEHKR